MAQTTLPTLHHLTSSQSFAVLVALEEAAAMRPHGLEYTVTLYPRQGGTASEELKDIFPLGKSPILVVDPTGEQGEKEVLTESRFIMQYIADNYTEGEWKSAPEDRQRDAFFQEFAKSTLLAKADFTLIFDIVLQMLPFGIRHLVGLLFHPIMTHFKADLRDVYQFLEDNISPKKPWLSGTNFGLADLNALFGADLVVQRQYGLDPVKSPKLASWHRSLTNRASYQAALKKGGPYDLCTFE